jgi:cyclohexanone monooxygenase
VESVEYSYSFDPQIQQEWDWTERFATQPEILRYLNFVVDRLDLRRDITFGTTVTGAAFEEADNSWLVTTGRGEKVRARYLVMATGCLSASQMPDFPGLSSFKGEIYHTGQWPHRQVDFAGKRVGVIGTGSSGVQLIPQVAKEAAQLFVFQRTPTFSVPARNQPLSEEKVRHWKDNYPELRRKAREETRTGWLAEMPIGSALAARPEDRETEYRRRWKNGGANFLYAYDDICRDEAANRTAADFVRARIAEIVKDTKTAELLTPTDYPIGSKRICVDTDYYETFNRENVTLVDVSAAPIAGMTPDGLRTADAAYELDVIVFATGFDAMTGALTRLDPRGAGGARLPAKWDAGPTNYLGIMTTGFPNFFMVTGPGSPAVLSNVVVSIEQHVEWLADLFAYMKEKGYQRIEPAPEAERAWVEHCNELASRTLSGKGKSWYTGANIPGKPRVMMPYMGGVDTYRRKCAEVAAKGYEGFRLSKARAAQPA